MRIALVFLLVGSSVCAQDQQMGARTKGMGGSYTAFEDDPVSIFLNPAGIATQPDQISITYQTYTAYTVRGKRGLDNSIDNSVDSDTILADPPIIPSYLGAVFQLGDAESPMAIGICFARPYHLKYAMDEVEDVHQTEFIPDSNMEQSLARFRAAFAYDFRFRKVGEAGFFNHIGVGVGLDVGYVNWEFAGPEIEKDDRQTSFGFGMGLLVGIYDNAESFKVNFGIAYHSPIQYDFSLEPDILPAFDMPQQLNLGFTFFLLEGTPLRITSDFQWINWSETAERPGLGSVFPEFEDAFNFSLGLEYRIVLSDSVSLLPRLGYRYFDAPWDDGDNLPVTGVYKLVLETEGDLFHMATAGLGVSWTTEEGKTRSVDLAGDVGGDSFNLALGYTHEF